MHERDVKCPDKYCRYTMLPFNPPLQRTLCEFDHPNSLYDLQHLAFSSHRSWPFEAPPSLTYSHPANRSISPVRDHDIRIIQHSPPVSKSNCPLRIGFLSTLTVKIFIIISLNRKNLPSLNSRVMSRSETATTSFDLRPASVAPASSSTSGIVNTEHHANEAPRSQNGRNRRAGPRGRGGRGVRGRGRARAETAGGTNREATGGETTSIEIPQQQSSNHSHRGRRNIPQGRNTASAHQRPLQNLGEASNSAAVLRPEAPEFDPGQQYQPHDNVREQKSKTASNQTQRSGQDGRSKQRRASLLKSSAPDIATRTHEDIENGVYECPICTSEINKKSRIWSCKTCWTVFHLECIVRWSTNEGSTVAVPLQENGELPPSRQWRCPGCNLPKEILPSQYTCWCEKEFDPHSTPGLPPHSCGQTCGKIRRIPAKCPHPCDLLCHAGPCPPCSHFGPVQSCFCGKKMVSRKCVDTNYESGWSCDEVCGDVMPCGEHICSRPCHEGLCGACEVSLQAQCYCGKERRSIPCCERQDRKTSRHKSEDGSISEWNGLFDCKRACGRPFDCGKHRCQKPCHPQDGEVCHCPYSPDLVDRCPCGKSNLAELLPSPRETCEDSIPNCTKQCLKLLSCGHTCQQVCHLGGCMPCLQRMEISCRCGRTKSLTICHQGYDEPPQCMRMCKAILNCSRHECGDHCCSGERKAAERQATKRKLRPLGAAHLVDEGFEAEHICTRVCGRPLKCGNHTCPELCHKGPCGTCREAIFHDISCNCGKTVLQPPLPCGTAPPPCRFECERPKNCGHPRIPHSCHLDNETCPKCPFLEPKVCLCEKNTLKNQPCWLSEVRCGEVCGKKLKCGLHFCRKQCHRRGECEDLGKKCQQVCRKAKKACGHPCEADCHAPSSCLEDKPCQNKMMITCECQRLKQEIKCLASKDGEGNTKKILSCDEECARLARNQSLAIALNVDPNHQDDHVPYSKETLRLYRENSKFAQIQEQGFRIFAADESQKRMRLLPMPKHHRAFIHALAEDFHLDSESMDPEPFRHVAIFKTPRFVMAPMKTLAECVRIRNTAQANQLQSATSAPEAPKRLKASNEPFNGYLLSNLRFGLTIEELRSNISPDLKSTPGLTYDISFLPSEEIAIKARPATASTISVLTPQSIESTLRSLKPAIKSTITTHTFASTLQLCSFDHSLNILRRELDESATNGGWSQVAAKAAAPRSAPLRHPVVGARSAYTVLGSRVKEGKKRKGEGDVVDDWEEEVKRWEVDEEIENEKKGKEGQSAERGVDDNGESGGGGENAEVSTTSASASASA